MWSEKSLCKSTLFTVDGKGYTLFLDQSTCERDKVKEWLTIETTGKVLELEECMDVIQLGVLGELVRMSSMNDCSYRES
jgi:predicted transcriptional regulator